MPTPSELALFETIEKENARYNNMQHHAHFYLAFLRFCLSMNEINVRYKKGKSIALPLTIRITDYKYLNNYRQKLTEASNTERYQRSINLKSLYENKEDLVRITNDLFSMAIIQLADEPPRPETGSLRNEAKYRISANVEQAVATLHSSLIARYSDKPLSYYPKNQTIPQKAVFEMQDRFPQYLSAIAASQRRENNELQEQVNAQQQLVSNSASLASENAELNRQIGLLERQIELAEFADTERQTQTETITQQAEKIATLEAQLAQAEQQAPPMPAQSASSSSPKRKDRSWERSTIVHFGDDTPPSPTQSIAPSFAGSQCTMFSSASQAQAGRNISHHLSFSEALKKWLVELRIVPSSSKDRSESTMNSKTLKPLVFFRQEMIQKIFSFTKDYKGQLPDGLLPLLYQLQLQIVFISKPLEEIFNDFTKSDTYKRSTSEALRQEIAGWPAQIREQLEPAKQTGWDQELPPVRLLQSAETGNRNDNSLTEVFNYFRSLLDAEKLAALPHDFREYCADSEKSPGFNNLLTAIASGNKTKQHQVMGDFITELEQAFSLAESVRPAKLQKTS